MTTEDLLRGVIRGDPAAAFDLGLRLAERRPLPSHTEEPCAECNGSGRGPTIFNPRGPDFATRCEACRGVGVRYACAGCGGLRVESGKPRAGECQC